MMIDTLGAMCLNRVMTTTDADLATLRDAHYAAATTKDAYNIDAKAWQARETAFNAWAKASNLRESVK
jgi:hypothetical protein